MVVDDRGHFLEGLGWQQADMGVSGEHRAGLQLPEAGEAQGLQGHLQLALNGVKDEKQGGSGALGRTAVLKPLQS